MIVALSMTTSANAGVISGLLPVISALVATLALKERLSAQLWISIAAVTSGALTININSILAARFDPTQLFGNSLIVLAVCCEALFGILNKKIKRSLPPLYIAALMSSISLVLTFPLATGTLIFGAGFSISPRAIAATAYIAIFPTVIGFWLWYSGTARIRAGEASVYMAVLPVAALALSYLLLGEEIMPAHLIGVCLVIAGIIQAIRNG